MICKKFVLLTVNNWGPFPIIPISFTQFDLTTEVTTVFDLRVYYLF